MWRNVLFTLFIILIVALVLLFSWISQPIDQGMACIDRGESVISIEYTTNVPCWFHVRYCSNYTCGFDHYGFGIHHKAYFSTANGENCFDIQMIFVGLTGKITVQDYCLERYGKRY